MHNGAIIKVSERASARNLVDRLRKRKVKPIVKYQGGKTRELPLIKTLLQNYDTVLEPFAGGAAVSFALGHRCILNDMNDALINMYQQVSHPTTFHEVFSHVNWLKTLEHDDLSVEYYKARDYINGKHVYTHGQYHISQWGLLQWYGRYNAKGKFNVPFGHYKSSHVTLLESYEVLTSIR